MNNFNTIAPYYDLLAKLIFGNCINKAQEDLIRHIPANSKVLVVGGGTGKVLKAILEICHPGRVTYWELSSKMIEIAWNRLNASELEKVEFIHNSIEHIDEFEKYDVVITPFVLDMFSKDRLVSIMEKLYLSLKKEGCWLFVDFKVEDAGLKRFWQIPLLKFMFVFFRITCQMENNQLPDFERYFSLFSLKLLNKRFYYRNMIFTCVYTKGNECKDSLV